MTNPIPQNYEAALRAWVELEKQVKQLRKFAAKVVAERDDWQATCDTQLAAQRQIMDTNYALAVRVERAETAVREAHTEMYSEVGSQAHGLGPCSCDICAELTKARSDG